MRIKFNCEYCGKECEQIPSIYNRSKHHFCCRECKDRSRGRSVKCICDYCGKSFMRNEYNVTNSKKHYCSKDCKDNDNIKQIIFNCDYCGKESTMTPYRYGRCEHHFCSNECKNQYQIGENHPKFNVDITDEERKTKRNYQEYHDFVNNVLQRDNYQCQLSGKTGTGLVVHHIDGYNWCIDGRTDPDNGITISREIHDLFHKLYGKGNNTYEQFEEFCDLYNLYN